MNTGNGATDKPIDTIETNIFLMLPVSLDVVYEAGATQEQIQPLLIEAIKERVLSDAPKHKPEHVVVHCAYTIGNTDYKLKMLGNGNVVPENAPSKIIKP